MPKFSSFLVLLLVSSAAARDIHVSNLAGDDRFTGREADSMSDGTGPVRTITRALRVALAGDRIVLAKTGEPYRESISLVGSRHSGYPKRPFTIEGNGAILDGSAPVPAEAWQNFGGAVFRFQPPHGGHQRLFLDNRPADRIAVGPMAGAPPKLKPLQWCFFEGRIYFCVEPNKLPEDYNPTHADKQTGITLFHVRLVGIVDLTVQGFRVDGISAYNSARDVYLGGVTCRGNGRSGVAVGGASQVEIDAALLGNNGEAQLLTLPMSETRVRNSELFSNTAPGWVDKGGRVTIDDKRVEGGLDDRKNEGD